jgi:hypothetical protein
MTKSLNFSTAIFKAPFASHLLSHLQISTMEPIGLALGSIALAGLFSTCVDCFELVEGGRDYGRDSAILLTKLEIERTRFLIWGEAVGLLESSATGRNPKLDDPQLRTTIENILICIKLVFTDTDNLRVKYGLEPISDQARSPTSSSQQPDAIRVSANGLTKFRAKYTQFLLRVQSAQKKTNFSKKTQWAIHDRRSLSTWWWI